MKIAGRTINSVANIASRLWSMISTVVFLPLYLAYLGEEAYGLVTLFVTLQATMSLLGLGLSSTLRREFSLGDDSDKNKEYKRKLLITVENMYYVVCIIIIIACYILSGTIANRWLADNFLSVDIVSKAISLMGVIIAIQMLCNLWHGCLLGLNYQFKANVYQILFSLIKNSLAVVACYYFRSIIIYYFAFMIVDILYCFVLRISVGKYLENNNKTDWKISDIKLIKKVWKYAVGILSISILSLLLTQLDKMILSRYLPLKEIGVYNSIFTIGSLSRVLSTGVSVTVLTEFSQLYSTKNFSKLERNYVSTWNGVAIFTVCVVTYVAFFAETIMLVWTRNDFYATTASIYAPYLMIGIGAVALQEIPYSYLLAQGKTRINIILGIFILPIYCISKESNISHNTYCKNCNTLPDRNIISF